jgi:hypothetical protein
MCCYVIDSNEALRADIPGPTTRPVQGWPPAAHRVVGAELSRINPSFDRFCVTVNLHWVESESKSQHRRTARRGVFKGVEDGHKPPALWAGHPCNGRKAVSRVAHLQGVERYGVDGPSDTIGSPWPPLAHALAHAHDSQKVNSFPEKKSGRRVSHVEWI